MEEQKTLHRLEPGRSAVIEELSVYGEQRRRLQDIGLIEGTRVTCLQKSPGGGPTAYLIRGAVIALRQEDTRQIWIRSDGGENRGR